VNKGLILCADVQIMHIMVHGYLLSAFLGGYENSREYAYPPY
jgi:hypothetical protein